MCAEVSHPTETITRHTRFHALVQMCRGLPPVRMAVVHPCDAPSSLGVRDSTQIGLIDPILVGPRLRIRKAAQSIGWDLACVEIVDAPHSHAAAETAAALVNMGRISALMKGSLHTDELMHALLGREAGLHTDRVASHAFAIDVPGYGHPLIVSDAALNIRPDLEAKRDICQNAILLAHTLGIVEPRVAVLAAVETVHSSMTATVDAAALSKMAERGQLVGANVDGPLAMDNALSEAARRDKHIRSRVAGRANVLIVPSIEAGNILVKQLVLLADAIAAGVVLGLKVPIALTSRADDARARVASAAMARLLVAQPEVECLAMLRSAADAQSAS
jgi:phosphate acetyltransferase